MKFYIGCDGWKSQTWAKNFYPDGLDPANYLSYYSNVFNFVHIDLENSAYTPNSYLLKKWLDDTPDNFRFSIRIPQKIIDKTAIPYSSPSSSPFASPPNIDTNHNHRDLLGRFLEDLHPIEEKILVVILSPPSYVSLQNNGRKWLEETLTKCVYHGYSVAVDFDKRSNWYQELTYNILKKYKSSFVWSNSTHQYYYPAVTSNFILLDFGGSYINKQTAIRYLDLIIQKAMENKQRPNCPIDSLDYSIMITKNPPIAKLLQKLVSLKQNSDSNLEPMQQDQNDSLTWSGRVVMHIDMNAFFPACEELRDASLKGKPHAVIMTPEKEGEIITRGAVASCSYEARKFGVRSAMSLSRAKELCPGLILRPVDKEYYNSISQQVMRLLEEYSDVLEQTSIDEAFIDCTKKLMTLQQKKSSQHNFGQLDESFSKETMNENKESILNPIFLSKLQPGTPYQHSSASERKSLVEEYALKIKNSIREQCNGLMCSIGVANNKSVAKIASDIQKPDGLTIVYPQNTMTFLSKLKVDQVSGIGIKTAKTLKDMGINTIGDLSQTDVQILLEKFGKKHGLWMWQIANGKENDPVIPRGDNISLSTEETLLEPINDRDEILKILLTSLADDIHKRLERKGYEFKTVGIKLVRTNFSIETREFTFPSYQRTRNSICSVMELLLDRFNFEDMKVKTNNDNSIKRKIYPSYIRKLGIKVSNLSRIDVNKKRSQKSILDFI